MFIKKAKREELTRSLSGLTIGVKAGLFAKEGRLNFDDLTSSSDNLKTPLSIIYVNTLGDDDQKGFFITIFLTELFKWILQHPGKKRPKVVLYMDEIGPYVPAKSGAPSKEIIARILWEARKYGLGLIVCTQNVSDVENRVWNQIDTLAIGRMATPAQIKAIQPIIEGYAQVNPNKKINTKKIIESLPGIKDRNFVLLSSFTDSLNVFQTRELLTELGGVIIKSELKDYLKSLEK
jgi:hypothetical protein